MREVLGSVRRECLDHMLILGERHLYRVIREYVQYYNMARPHQGIDQRIPEVAYQSAGAVREGQQVEQGQRASPGTDGAGGRVISVPILGGLHHDYRRAA